MLTFWVQVLLSAVLASRAGELEVGLLFLFLGYGMMNLSLHRCHWLGWRDLQGRVGNKVCLARGW